MITLEELLLSVLLYIYGGLALSRMYVTSNTLVFTKRVNNLEKFLTKSTSKC